MLKDMGIQVWFERPASARAELPSQDLAEPSQKLVQPGHETDVEARVSPPTTGDTPNSAQLKQSLLDQAIAHGRGSGGGEEMGAAEVRGVNFESNESNLKMCKPCRCGRSTQSWSMCLDVMVDVTVASS